MTSSSLKVELKSAIDGFPGGYQTIAINNDSGGKMEISFHRTVRIPDDGKNYELPPNLGKFPLFSIDDHAEKLPVDIVRKGGVFIPIRQREALWIKFHAYGTSRFAVKVFVNGINAMSDESRHCEMKPGEPIAESDGEQDYLVVPGQEWFGDFVRTNKTVMQPVAVPTGSGYSVEAQIKVLRLCGDFGSSNLSSWEKEQLQKKMKREFEKMKKEFYDKEHELTLVPRGSIHQAIRRDCFHKNRYDEKNAVMFNIQLLAPKTFHLVTGTPPPQTPVSAKTYARYGYPFFQMYNEPGAFTGTLEEFPKTVEDIYKEKIVNLEVHQPDSVLHFRSVQLKTVDKMSQFYIETASNKNGQN
ncbi:hypothetical protein BOTNAR_0698g00030 [Botryotinia narcissicola]|uniref:Uncharacterized protein n=1 Tax=Botryotinia narcissicola TaxID=278944 RepID=A0A4Z1H7Q6_9HELO|nr:hypothetical protein BOTNAR_0698g00030 [Botryotinia narcissicola]